MLRLNVGLSKKVGQPHFGSKGASLQIEAEVETGLLQEPVRLKEYLRRLFVLVRESLEEELNSGGGDGGEVIRPGLPPPEDPKPTGMGPPAQGLAIPPPEEPLGNRQRTTPVRLATPAQCGAITALVRRQRQDLEALLEEHAGKTTVQELTLTEASQLISYLRLRETSPVGQEV